MSVEQRVLDGDQQVAEKHAERCKSLSNSR